MIDQSTNRKLNSSKVHRSPLSSDSRRQTQISTKWIKLNNQNIDDNKISLIEQNLVKNSKIKKLDLS